MIIHKIFGILIICLTASITQAQFDVIRGSDIEDYMLIKQQDPFGRQADDVEGSPYLNDTFLPGDVYTAKGIFKNIAMRYDGYHDWVEFKKNDKIYILDPTTELLRIVLQDQVWYVQAYEVNDKIKLGFFGLLVEGRVKLMIKKSIKFEDRRLAKALESKGTPPRYIPGKDQFFLRVDTRPAMPLESAKKIAAMMPDHQNSIASYVKRKKTALRQTDLVDLMVYYQKLDAK